MKQLQITPVLYTYELKPRDKLIIHKNNINTYIIAEGVLVIHKAFSNEERHAVCMLSSGDITITPFSPTATINYFYEIEAISKSYILSCSNESDKTLKALVNTRYNNSILNYHDIIEILTHKNIKQRIIHFFLILSELFGEYKKNFLIINLSISYQSLGSIIGTNKNTVNKLIKELEKNNLIAYSQNQIVINNLIHLSQYGLNN